MASHSTGATTASEKFSARLSIAARATPAWSSAAVSRPTMCDTAARLGGEVAGFERGGDIGDVPVQAALRDQGAGDQRDDENAERQAQQCVLDDEGDRSDNAENDQKRNNARGTASSRASARRRD